jgi:N-acetylmuramoyl-L-alanine amidase
MERMPCTALLIECGFLSNPQEEARLRNPAYQQKLCAVIATGLGSFLSNT